ncbi:glucose-6-phosphate isomerase [Desulfogranum mediterraneum]|uniref:glucose-6-phosphate isomerase n=1 Tax=Desulfogranum mediterraneum TaxID=160661 RepID=UPI0004095C23|nr:glucose-6-phosphate isomerase [Desulfogranum mediterraneum]
MEFIDFNQLAAVDTLTRLAASPYDLSAAGSLSPERLKRYCCQNEYFDLLYATQRLDDQVLDSLQELADEAGLVDKYLAMQEGAVLNRIDGYPSEERQVLHTACRDIFSTPARAPEATAQAKAELTKLERFLRELSEGAILSQGQQPFTTMVQVGIGGSDLGPRALYQALEAFNLPGRRACFIANVDPDDVAGVLRGLDLERTLFNVVSKSGTTLETLTNEQLVREALLAAGCDPARQMIAVTGKGSPMDDPSRYLASFYMYDSIGGRYSATSMVGGVTLAFALGMDSFRAILKGANAMDRAAEERDIRANIPLLMALIGIWNHNFLACPTVAVLPYSQALARFPAHLQQCDMESNGKAVTCQGHPVSWKTGPVVWGEPGTNGQHAFYQLLHQGTEIVPAEFIGFRASQYGRDVQVKGTNSQQKLLANMLAQSLALASGRGNDNPARRFAGNRPSMTLIADRLTPEVMGGLLALYEHRIAFQGFCWNINSFDQEGVQLGKILAEKLLAHLAEPSGQSEGENLEKSMLRVAGIG